MEHKNRRGGRQAGAQLSGQDQHSFTWRKGKPAQEKVADHRQLAGEQKLPQACRGALVSARRPAKSGCQRQDQDAKRGQGHRDRHDRTCSARDELKRHATNCNLQKQQDEVSEGRQMFTATKDLMLPATVTGSWPRPRWYDGGLWGRPLDTALLDVKFREQFLDAHSTVIADQERAGLDILTNGDYHLDEDFAGRSWHHYPLQRWKGLEHEELQYGSSRDALLNFPAGSLMYEIESTWRWPRVVGKVEADPRNPLEYAKLWRIAQARAASGKPVKFGTCSSQVLAIFLDSHTAEYDREDKKQLIWDMATAMNQELRQLAAAGAKVIQIEEPDDPLHCLLPSRGEGTARLHGRGVQSRGRRARRCRALDTHVLGQPEHAEGLQRRVLRQLDRYIPQSVERRRLDCRNDGARVRRDRPVQALRQQPVKEGRGGRGQPSAAASGSACRSSRGVSGRLST